MRLFIEIRMVRKIAVSRLKTASISPSEFQDPCKPALHEHLKTRIVTLYNIPFQTDDK